MTYLPYATGDMGTMHKVRWYDAQSTMVRKKEGDPAGLLFLIIARTRACRGRLTGKPGKRLRPSDSPARTDP